MTAYGNNRHSAVVMVLVTDQFQCQRLIVAGRALADSHNLQLEVINVANPDLQQNPEAVEFLYQVSKEHDATMMVHYSSEPARQLFEIIKERQPLVVVSGLPQQENSLLHKIWARFADTDFFMVDGQGEISPVTLGDRVIA